MAKSKVESAFENYLANGLPDIDPKEKLKVRILTRLYREINQARTPILVHLQDDADVMAIWAQAEQLERLIARTFDASKLSEAQSNQPLDDET